MPRSASKSTESLIEDVIIALALVAGRMEAQRAIYRLNAPQYRRPSRKKDAEPLVVRFEDTTSSSIRTVGDGVEQ